MIRHSRTPPHQVAFITQCALGLAGLLIGANSLANQVLIQDVTIISPERNEPVKHQQVLIRDGRIVAIGQHIPIPQNEHTRINGKNKYLTPGLMDSHVHLSMAPGLPMPLPNSPQMQALAQAYAQQQPRSYLYHGVTQLLDPSNQAVGIAEFQAQAQKPDLLRCGAAPILNGYPSNFLPPEQRLDFMPDFIFDPKSSDSLPAGIAAEDHTPEAVVARIKKSGAVCVKLFIEDGFGDQHHLPIPSKEILARTRKAAHDAKLLVLGHANATDMQTIAVNADVDVIAHGTWNWNAEERALGQKDLTKIPPSVAQLMQDIHAKKIGYQPTLGVLPGIAALFKEDTLLNPAYRRVFPAALLDWYQTPDAAWFKNMLKEEDQIEDVAMFFRINERVQAQAERALKYLYDLGHPILLASDTPSSPTYGNPPGLNTYMEMQRLATVGISLQDILKAGTINNAKQFGLAHDYGTVQVGKVANLLLLNADPLQSVQAWDQIDTVLLHGEPIARDELMAPAPRKVSTSDQ